MAIEVKERPPLHLAVTVETAGNVRYRWGAGERSGEDVPQDVEFSTAMPGGHDQATCSLVRSDDRDYPDLNRFDKLTVYGPGVRTAWKGRLAEHPSEHSEQFRINPAAVGYSAHLKDDTSFREIYVDVDFSHWRGASPQRQINMTGAAYNASVGPQVAADPTQGNNALQLTQNGSWVAATKPAVEAWYDGSSIKLDSIYYAWNKNANISAADTNWTWKAYLLDDDVASSYDGTAELRGAGPGTGTLTATTATRDWALLQLGYVAGPAGADNTDYTIYWSRLAVYGRHGLTKQGTESATTSKGFLASDVVADIVKRAAPLLTYSTGSGGSIQASSFVIPHLMIGETAGVTADEAIRQANRFELYDWAVYDDPGAPYGEFLYAPAGSIKGKRTWHLRLSDGVRLQNEGPQGEDDYNGVMVYYTDPTTQSTRSVGPPGSGADTTDTTLADTSSTNPVNAHGISKRYLTLDNVGVLTSAGAIQLGAIALVEVQKRNVRGEAEVKGWATDDKGAVHPAWVIRSGDSCRFMDAADTTSRRIVATRYSHSALTNTLTLDALPNHLTGIIEALQAQQVGSVI